MSPAPQDRATGPLGLLGSLAAAVAITCLALALASLLPVGPDMPELWRTSSGAPSAST